MLKLRWQHEQITLPLKKLECEGCVMHFHVYIYKTILYLSIYLSVYIYIYIAVPV